MHSAGGQGGVCLAGAGEEWDLLRELRHRATELRRESGFNWAV